MFLEFGFAMQEFSAFVISDSSSNDFRSHILRSSFDNSNGRASVLIGSEETAAISKPAPSSVGDL
jgi:hypothetical protein